MAIDRGPWNALVDDDGSNLVGTVFGKEDIKTVLLDPIDGIGTWQNIPFSAANFSGVAPMVWTVGSAAVIRNRYALVGKTLFWSFYVSWFSGSNVLSGSPSSVIVMTLPGGLTSTCNGLINYCAGIAGAPAIAGLQAEAAGATIRISKATGNYALTDVPGMITTLVLEVA